MQIIADISLYPLTDDFLPAIDDVIERFHAHDGIEVTTNRLSTQLAGEYDAIMMLLTEELRATFEQHGKAVFVMKILPLGTSS